MATEIRTEVDNEVRTEVQHNVPVGYKQRADGTLVPETMIAAIDKLRDQTIEQLIVGAKAQQQNLAEFRKRAFSDIETFIATSLENYGIKTGGKKGNVTLVSFDGRYKVVRHVQERLVFDERLQAAKELIDACIMRWSEGSRDEIKVLVNDAFRVDYEGKISTGRVLGLRRLQIADEQWQLAMQAISDSVRVDGSKPYVRFYEKKQPNGEYEPISLDIAGV